MYCPLLLITLGEWIETNLFAIIAILIKLGALIIWLVRLEGRVNQVHGEVTDMKKEHEEQSKELRKHTADEAKHVNHFHMRSMEQRIDRLDNRIDKLEITMSQGFEKTLSRIDTLLRRD